MLALQVEHEVEDLRLDRHVERGHRLVGDDQRRPQHQRPGQAEALPLPAGELVRVALGRGARQPHLVEQRVHRRCCSRPLPLPWMTSGSRRIVPTRIRGSIDA